MRTPLRPRGPSGRTPAGSTVAILGPRVMLACGRSAGVDVDALLAELGLAREALVDPGALLHHAHRARRHRARRARR